MADSDTWKPTYKYPNTRYWYAWSFQMALGMMKYRVLGWLIVKKSTHRFEKSWKSIEIDHASYIHFVAGFQDSQAEEAECGQDNLKKNVRHRVWDVPFASTLDHPRRAYLHLANVGRYTVRVYLREIPVQRAGRVRLKLCEWYSVEIGQGNMDKVA